MTADRPPPPTAPSLLRPDSRPLLYVAAVIVAALAAIAFVLSFSALRDLAVAAGVSAELAWLWPLAVDGNIVVNTLAGLLLRPRGRRTTWYPWAALFWFAGVSVVGNGLHATASDGQHLDPAVAFAVSAIPAVALLQGTHLFVVMLSAPPPASPATSNRRPAGSRPTARPQPGKERTRQPGRTASRNGGTPDAGTGQTAVLRAKLADAARTGARVTGADVARWLGVSERTGRRRLAQALAAEPELTHQLNTASPTPSDSHPDEVHP